jgi:hypothetical protein
MAGARARRVELIAAHYLSVKLNFRKRRCAAHKAHFFS